MLRNNTYVYSFMFDNIMVLTLTFILIIHILFIFTIYHIAFTDFFLFGPV